MVHKLRIKVHEKSPNTIIIVLKTTRGHWELAHDPRFREGYLNLKKKKHQKKRHFLFDDFHYFHVFLVAFFFCNFLSEVSKSNLKETKSTPQVAINWF